MDLLSRKSVCNLPTVIWLYSRSATITLKNESFSTGNGLGIRVVGGKEIPGTRGEIGAYIAKVTPGGVAEQTGKVVEGESLCSYGILRQASLQSAVGHLLAVIKTVMATITVHRMKVDIWENNGITSLCKLLKLKEVHCNIDFWVLACRSTSQCPISACDRLMV